MFFHAIFGYIFLLFFFISSSLILTYCHSLPTFLRYMFIAACEQFPKGPHYNICPKNEECGKGSCLKKVSSQSSYFYYDLIIFFMSGTVFVIYLIYFMFLCLYLSVCLSLELATLIYPSLYISHSLCLSLIKDTFRRNNHFVNSNDSLLSFNSLWFPLTISLSAICLSPCLSV